MYYNFQGKIKFVTVSLNFWTALIQENVKEKNLKV